jgi:1-acyl-sn-glycerol-3-phosphate acyltransferase
VVPPRWIRRLVLAPAIGLLTLLLITTIPLTAIVAAFASPLLPGRLRPLRILAFVLLFLVAETLTLVALFALWIASGFGRRVGSPRWQAAHYALMRTHLRVLVHTAQRTFNLGIDIDPPIAPPGSSGEPSRPLIVLSRHAGPGDSFLLVHALLERGRRPRIVLRDTLKWAPVLDVLLHRVPSVFLTPGNARQRTSARIAALATTLGPRDALVLFPEGRNFTPTRRLHSITRLEELGRRSEADQAREMRHVLTPRPGARSRRCGPRRSRTWCSSATPGSKACPASSTCGAGCRWTPASRLVPGACRPARRPATGGPVRTGSWTGGATSTRGSSRPRAFGRFRTRLPRRSRT